MAVEAYVDGSPVIVASVLGSYPAAAQNSGATYIKGDPGPQGPPGPAGQDGQDGQDGFSPTVTPSSITGGHRLTIVDVDGTSTVDVMDGVDGQDGSDGQDGFSPTITSTSIAGGHRLTITDVDSTKTVDVMDGVDGTNGTNGTDGAAAGFGTPTATIDANIGTPGVTVTSSGPDTAKVFDFEFTNLKGATGATGQRGFGTFQISTAPTSYTTTTGGFNPKYRI